MKRISKKKVFEVISRVLSVVLMVSLVLPGNIKVTATPKAVETFIINDHDTSGATNKFTYSSDWDVSTGITSRFHNGDEHWALVAKGAANAADTNYTVTFDGNKIELYGTKQPKHGKYAISIDGGEEVIVDAYNATIVDKAKLFESEVLEEGTHTMTVKGTGDATGTEANMQVDYAVVTTGEEVEGEEKVYTTDINDSEIGDGLNKFQYFGSWGTSSGSDYFGGDEHWSSISKGSANAANNYSTIKFYGSKIELYATKAPAHGIYAISIDGGEEVEVDAYNASRIHQQKIYTSPKLTTGVHTIKIRATGKANASAREASVQLDYAKVYHPEIKAESIEMNKKNLNLEIGIKADLSVVFNPSNTSIRDLEWSTSDEEVVTVDNGTIVATGFGNATVTARLVGTDLEATCDISVTEGNEYIRGFIGSTERHHLQENVSDYISEFNSFEELVAWKGDTAISKIVLYAKLNGAQNVTAISSDLVDANGNVISADNVKSTFLKDVNATLGGVQPGEGFGQVIPNQPRQEVPEILYTTEPVSVEPHRVQQIWVEFDIPRDAKAGVYTSQIEVIADGMEEPLVFDYEVEVLDIEQPTYEDSKFHLDLWQYPYSSARYYEVEPFSEEHFEILKPQMELYKEAGGKTITTTIVEDAWNNQCYDKYTSMVKWTKKADGTFAFDFTDFDKWVAFNLELGINKQISAYSMVPWNNRIIYTDETTGNQVEETPYPGTARWIEMWEQFLDVFVSHLDEKGWFDMVYIAMDERPVAQMISALDLIESKPNKEGHTLKVSGAMNYSTMDRNVLNRIDDISIHAAHTNHNNGEVRQLAEERRELGLNTTLYTCTGSYPSNFTRSEPSENIWTIWYSQYHNTDGYLRWALDSWTENPLEDSSHWYFEAGDTFLIYPGDKGTENIQARSSVRLEKIAEAIRDVEKVNFIKENAPELAAEVDELLNSIGRYGGYGNGWGMAEGSEATKQTIANEAVRIKNTVAEISRAYVELNQVSVESVTLDTTESELPVGESVTLTATVLPENATNKNVTWSSSDESVAVVNNSGVVTAVAEGNAIITVSTVDGGLQATCTVIVNSNVVVDADKTLLAATIKYAEEVEAEGALEGVVPVVVQEFRAALAEANTVLASESANQAEVDAITNRLLNAIWMLEFKGGDKSTLKNNIDIAEALNSKDYTSDSWANLQEVLAEAIKVYEDENALKADIEEANKNLEDAIKALVSNDVDKSKLEDLVNKMTGLDEEEYIPSTWAAMQDKLTVANEVLANENVTQEAVDSAYNELLRAYLGLRLKPSKDKLEGLINKGEALNKEAYTASSWDAVETALDKARTVMNNSEATANDVAKAEKDLEVAMAKLVLVSSNNTNSGNTNSGNTNQNGSLPKTGATSSVVAIALGAALAGSGFAIKRKRK